MTVGARGAYVTRPPLFACAQCPTFLLASARLAGTTFAAPSSSRYHHQGTRMCRVEKPDLPPPNRTKSKNRHGENVGRLFFFQRALQRLIICRTYGNHYYKYLISRPTEHTVFFFLFNKLISHSTRFDGRRRHHHPPRRSTTTEGSYFIPYRVLCFFSFPAAFYFPPSAQRRRPTNPNLSRREDDG